MKKTLQNASILAMTLLPQIALAQLGSFKPTGTGLSSRPLEQVATSILNAVLGFLFIIVLAVILYGGFRWMTAAGDEDAISTAKKTITAGVIGLVVVMIAYAVVNFVVTTVG